MPASRQSNKDQCQTCHEDLQWIGHEFDEVEEIHLKAEQLRTKSFIKRHSDKGQVSDMKEILDLAEKNVCFSELNYKSLTEKMKIKALPMLVFSAG